MAAPLALPLSTLFVCLFLCLLALASGRSSVQLQNRKCSVAIAASSSSSCSSCSLFLILLHVPVPVTCSFSGHAIHASQETCDICDVNPVHTALVYSWRSRVLGTARSVNVSWPRLASGAAGLVPWRTPRPSADCIRCARKPGTRARRAWRGVASASRCSLEPVIGQMRLGH